MSIWILSTHSEYAKKKKGVLIVDCFKFLLLSLGNKIKPWQGQQAVIFEGHGSSLTAWKQRLVEPLSTKSQKVPNVSLRQCRLRILS